MITILLIFIALMWIWSYVKFRRKMKYFTMMAAYLQSVVSSNPSLYNRLRFSSALIETQQYKEAYNIYTQLLKEGMNIPNKEQILLNIEFCKNPVPGVSSPKNFNFSWWHNFVLVRLGKRRYNFLTEEDYLKTNSILRNI